ncbi:MAG: DUF362 domain-containing protein [Phycisphaerae bacterium]
MKRIAAVAATTALARPAQALAQAIRQPVGSASDGGSRRLGSWPISQSRVTLIEDPRILPVRVVQRALLRDYLEEGLRVLTGARSTADAWHDILKPDDVVLIKFNRSAARAIGTTAAVAHTLVDSLVAVGWNSERLMLLESGLGSTRPHKTLAPDYRWQGEEVVFGRSGKDSFMAALDQATAIINVPFLKTHHLATMTCCLKNLSHGLIRHPARFHANGCDPAIGEISASSPIRDKLKLNIVNGLRVVFNRGPEAAERDMAAAGVLLIGQDPVACDATGFGILNKIRSLRELGPLLPGSRVPRQLVTASDLGLGQFDEEAIEVQRLGA